MKKLLLVDDDIGVLNALKRQLRALKLDITAELDVTAAIEHCQQQRYDLILSDQRMPEMEGTRFLKEVRGLQPSARCVLLSGYSDFDEVTEAFNQGVIDQFIAKPWDNGQLQASIRQLLGQDAPRASGCQRFHGMLSGDEVMLQRFDQIRRIACANAPVFIFGETGTGKELAAQAIHKESYRADQPFVAVNCANFSEQLMESELFGHKKGAFTHAVADRRGLLAEADGGTLFLDEVTTLPMELQARLLRVLQEREYRPVGDNRLFSFDIQLISASSTRLIDAVSQGQFRPDLQYRLEVIPLDLPPLRERGEDPVILFERFLQQLAPGKRWQLQSETAAMLRHCAFPGNVRQLYNIAQYTAAMATGPSVTPRDLPQHLLQSGGEAIAEVAATQAAVEPATALELDTMDAEALSELLQAHNNNRTATASTLGVSRMTLWRKMTALGLI